MKQPRLRSAVATKLAMDRIPLSVREQRAHHRLASDWAQRRSDAQADLRGAQDAFEQAKRLVPEAEQVLAEATARLADIEADALRHAARLGASAKRVEIFGEAESCGADSYTPRAAES